MTEQQRGQEIRTMNLSKNMKSIVLICFFAAFSFAICPGVAGDAPPSGTSSPAVVLKKREQSIREFMRTGKGDLSQMQSLDADAVAALRQALKNKDKSALTEAIQSSDPLTRLDTLRGIKEWDAVARKEILEAALHNKEIWPQFVKSGEMNMAKQLFEQEFSKLLEDYGAKIEPVALQSEQQRNSLAIRLVGKSTE